MSGNAATMSEAVVLSSESHTLDQLGIPCSLPTRPVRQPPRARRLMSFPARRLGRLTVFGASVIGAAVAFGNGATTPSALVKFDIPAESLVDALQAYSLQSGVQVMFETASAADYRSAAVEGELAPDVALRKLLASTDLRIRYSRPTAITLAPASAPNPDDPPADVLASADMTLDTLRVSDTAASDRRRLDGYISAVQVDIQKALKKVAAAQHGDYRVAIKLWVDPSRTVERAELEGSTGDRDRDGAITNALRGLVLSQAAPANTPQPMLFMISISSL